MCGLQLLPAMLGELHHRMAVNWIRGMRASTSASVEEETMTEPFCASSPEAAKLADDEFWEKVYHRMEHEIQQEDNDPPEMVVGFCLKCGGPLVAEDYQQLRKIIDRDEELCDDCTDELQPDIEEMF